MYAESFLVDNASDQSTQTSSHLSASWKGKMRLHGLPLPQELLDVIIDWLKDDKPTLRNCALVAQAWRPRSQVHIHHTLKVSSRECCQRAEHLYADAFLASCIREFHVLDPQIKHNHAVHHWLDYAVPAMLSTLNPLALDAVILQNAHDVEWGRYPEPLFPLATKLTVSRLDFRVGAEFAAFIRHFPRLTSLLLKDFTIEHNVRDIEAPGPRPPLQKLEMYSSTGQEFFMNWLLHQPPEDIQLETFLYSVERWQLRVPPPSLKALGACVKDITVVFAFESPHYLLKGDPILSSLSSARSLTFDFATLYSTLYGPPSIPLLLKELSAAARVSAVRFKFALDAHPAPLDSAVEKLERIKLAQTDALLHQLLPFSELQELSIQIRSDEWTRLKEVRSVDAWVASAEHTRTDERCYPPKLGDPSEVLYSAQVKLARLRAEFDLADVSWRKVTSVFEKEFPMMATRRILRVEPLGDGASERERWQPRYYNVYHHGRTDLFPPHIAFLQ